MSSVRCLTSSLFGVAVLIFFGLTYPHHLHYQEQYQLFLFDSTYVWEIVRQPGGIADLLGRFCTQFFLYAWVGAAIIAILLTMGLSLTTEVTVYRPLKKRKASLNVAMIASIGLMTVIVNLIAMLFGNETKVVDNSILKPYIWGDLIVTTPQMYQAVIGCALLLISLVVLKWTNWGIRLRALSADETLFSTLGYNPNATRTWVFLLSGAFIAAASCLTVYDVGMDPNMGMTVLINAVVAMIVGGVGRYGTCILGGLTLGVLQSFTVYWFSSNWQNAVTFLMLLILLFLRPQGIAGYKQRTV